MRRLNQEDGVTAVLIAILATVLIAFTALVVDVGSMNAEVRQLQNVADAAAVAIAQDCSGGACGDTAGTAQFYAVGNSRDLLSDTVVALPGESGANSVTVTATTRDVSGGNDGETNTLAWALAQAMNADELTFSRKATAAWGTMGGGATIPIAVCEHNWDYFTSNGANLPSGPPAHLVRFGSPNPNSPTVAEQDCTNPSGDTYPGGFGFLQRDGNCMAISEEGDLFPGSSGNNPVDNTSSCDVSALYAMLKALVDSGEPALIPIFDYWTGTGSNGHFHIIGYGAFVLTAYDIKGPGGTSKAYGSIPAGQCKANTSCLFGYYTQFVTIGEASTFAGSADYGAYFVGLTG